MYLELYLLCVVVSMASCCLAVRYAKQPLEVFMVFMAFSFVPFANVVIVGMNIVGLIAVGLYEHVRIVHSKIRRGK